ncbi:MAG: chemotaxis protein CheW [Gemmatimonadota bacterium]|nr:MAG: chemotaxis protein CheW [Gemmatimonadota bacterium]
MSNLITFRLGNSRFAIPADVVTEIVEAGSIKHSLPGDEGARVGLARVRDRWIPVVELAGAISGAPSLDPDSADALLLVLGRERGRLGLRVQGPGEVVQGCEARSPNDRSDDLLELDGEMVRFVDPAALVASRAELLGERGESMVDRDVAAEPLRVVRFQLGDDEFGIDVMKVFEVLPVPKVRPVPKAPAFVEGVVDVRDSIIPVIDMRKRFSLPERETDESSRLLIVAIGEARAALVVDTVPGVVPLAEDAVSPPPDFFRGLAGKYLEGLAKDDDRMIIMLNVGEILSSKEKIALEKVVDSAKPAARAKGKKRAPRRAKKKS